MKKVDTLSRHPDHDSGRGDNKEKIILTPEMFWSIHLADRGVMWKEIEEAEEFVEEEVRAAVESRNEGWRKEGKVITWKERVYVPDSATLREEILQLHHDQELAEHPGYTKTHELITWNYWWPRMMEDIKRYVAGCESCQTNKPDQQKKRNYLYPNEVPTQPWDIISVDLVGPLPISSGYNGIMVAVDRFSKMARYIPINMEISSRGVAQKLWERVFKDVGLPWKVISDRGPQFVSNFMKELCLRLGIERNPSTAYHPQTDGQTERVNQELEQYLRLYISYRQDDWVEWLPLAEFAYNNQSHSSTRRSPFFVNLGRHPNTGSEIKGTEEKVPTVDEFLEGIRETRREVKEALKKTNEIMKRKFNGKKGSKREYRAGELVWVDGSNLSDGHPSKKLSFKRAGPFPVVRKVGESSYELQIPKTWKNLHPVINEL